MVNDDADAFSSFCERAYFSLRYGPFRVVIWPILGREMGLIGVRNGLFRRTDGAKRGEKCPERAFREAFYGRRFSEMRKSEC